MRIKEYFYRLCERVGVDQNDEEGEYDTLRTLYVEPYEDVLGKDHFVIRIIDDIRDEYGMHDRLIYNMLEVMIALATYMSDNMYEVFGGEDMSSHYFWDMLSNLGLLACCGGSIQSPEDVQRAIQRVKDRKYCKDGKGGLFGELPDGQNPKTMDISDQALEYVQQETGLLAETEV